MLIWLFKNSNILYYKNKNKIKTNDKYLQQISQRANIPKKDLLEVKHSKRKMGKKYKGNSVN